MLPWWVFIFIIGLEVKRAQNMERQMNLIIVGCGRVGSELAFSVLREGHHVTMVDSSSDSFERLGVNFPGRTVHGSLLDREVLLRAGIEKADGLAAATSDDATNFVIARAAKELFKVPNVVARVYDPLRRVAFEALGIRAVASSSWGARRIKQLLTHSGNLPIYSLGHGEVILLEQEVDDSQVGLPLSILADNGRNYPVAIIRNGRALLPIPETILQAGDQVVISVSGESQKEQRAVIAQED
jgi:trk system potassium uptake protein TrkA